MMQTQAVIPIERCRVEQTRVIVRPDGAVDRKGASVILNKSAKTLANWALLGIGPKSWLIGGRRHYDYAECVAMARGEKPIDPAKAA